MKATVSTLAILATTGLASLHAGCSRDALAESRSDLDESSSSVPLPAPSGATAGAIEASKTRASAASSEKSARCPAGSVLVRGGNLVHLEHTADVEVADVCIDTREVSVADFRACVESGACKRDCVDPKACPAIPTRTDWGNPKEDDDISRLCNGNAPGLAQGAVDDHPVNCVSPDEARSYCASRGMRLPNGDEWEHAARGPRVSPWGTAVAVDEICWGRPKKRAGTCARRSFPKDVTPEGIYDLGGNVTEWTEAPARAGKTARFAYGASWYARDDGYAIAALGGVGMPGSRTETVGFRCAATPK